MAVTSTYLKGLCHEEAAVLGQFCAEVIIWSLFPQKNALLEIIVWVIFAGKALKHGPTFKFQSISILVIPSNKQLKQFQYLNIILNNKSGPLFWDSVDAKTSFSSKRDRKYQFSPFKLKLVQVIPEQGPWC